MAKEANISDEKVNFLSEMPLEEAEERERLNGGPYCKGEYIPIEDMLTITPDMEDMIDERRAFALAEEFEKQKMSEWPEP